VVTGPRRGDVWWVEVPGAGRRPALVLTRSAAIPLLNRVLVAPATRTVRSIPTEVLLGEEDGMPSPCALALDNLTVVPKAALGSRIAHLPDGRMAQVCAALLVAVACAGPAGRFEPVSAPAGAR
jgi:mRNA interferase MazF